MTTAAWWQFRPQIWFTRQGGTSGDLSEFAAAPHDHTFAVEVFGPIGFDVDNVALTGGAGTPTSPIRTWWKR